MSLKRRNVIAIILIFIASVCWTFGQQMLDAHTEGDTTSTTHPDIVETMYPAENTTANTNKESSFPTNPTNTAPAE